MPFNEKLNLERMIHTVFNFAASIGRAFPLK